MKIALWIPRYYDTSVKIYVDNIVPHLEKNGVIFISVSENDEIPSDVDLIWDPNLTGAKYPNKKILYTQQPWVVTLHGASNLSMPLHYNFSTTKEKLIGLFKNLRRRTAWFFYKEKVAQYITVSKFAKSEIANELNIDATVINVIYHGYDDTLFFPKSGKKEYLFHASMYQKKKNVERIIEAYSNIPIEERMPFILVCPGLTKQYSVEKLTVITQKLSAKEIARYMQEAYAFIFPSISESFGLPLIEAMACAVPVITSDSTACKEVVANAGITVNAQSTTAIQDAIQQLCINHQLRQQLAQQAEQRAKDFSWKKSAYLHFEVFKRVLS